MIFLGHYDAEAKWLGCHPQDRSMKRSDAGMSPIIAMSANAAAEDIINSRWMKKLLGWWMHYVQDIPEETA